MVMIMDKLIKVWSIGSLIKKLRNLIRLILLFRFWRGKILINCVGF
jgi:hypothetical protein